MSYPQGCSDSDALSNKELRKYEQLSEVLNPNLFKPPENDTAYFCYTNILTDFGDRLQRSSQLNN